MSRSKFRPMGQAQKPFSTTETSPMLMPLMPVRVRLRVERSSVGDTRTMHSVSVVNQPRLQRMFPTESPTAQRQAFVPQRRRSFTWASTFTAPWPVVNCGVGVTEVRANWEMVLWVVPIGLNWSQIQQAVNSPMHPSHLLSWGTIMVAPSFRAP